MPAKNKNEYNRIWTANKRKTNPEFYKQELLKQRPRSLLNATQKRIRRKYWMNKYKERRGCDRCNIKGPACIYDWHHLRDKVFAINADRTGKLKTLFEEIRKCILLCSNCHRITHKEMRDEKQRFCGS